MLTELQKALTLRFPTPCDRKLAKHLLMFNIIDSLVVEFSMLPTGGNFRAISKIKSIGCVFGKTKIRVCETPTIIIKVSDVCFEGDMPAAKHYF